MSLLSVIGGLFCERAPREPMEVVRAREASRHTILVIDDNKDFLDTCTSTLREAGYTVLKSSAGSKGLNMLRYAPKDISLVLLDFDMPQLDGSDTLKFIRKIAPDIKVAGITGVDPSILPSSYRDDIHAVLAKPFTSDQLREFVTGLLAAPLSVASVPAAK